MVYVLGMFDQHYDVRLTRPGPVVSQQHGIVVEAGAQGCVPLVVSMSVARAAQSALQRQDLMVVS